MSLCKTCQSIDFLSIPKLPATCTGYPMKNKSPALVSVSRKRPKQADADQNIEDALGLPFHQSLDALDQAATTCAICKVVKQDVTQLQKELTELEPDDRKYEKNPDWKMYLAKGINDVSGFMVVSVASERPSLVWILSVVGLCVDNDDPLATDVAGRKVEADELSEMTIQRAASWIQQCDAEHADNGCKTVDTDLPPKVIDVSVITEPEVVISYTPDAENGRYAVLSHMSRDKAFWEYKGNPAIMFLPKVFQDAIIVTRKLGLRYLWIDALCSTDDESSRSSPEYISIFSNAYITISATGSTLDSNGDRPAIRSPPSYNSFPYTHNSIDGTLYAFCLPKEPTLYPGNDRSLHLEPLSLQGWALQERLFSPRILHFGSTQMYFECNRHFLGEDGFKMIGREDTLPQDQSRGWRNVLNMYCRRSLPKPKDKLPAISNIARHIAEKTGDTYVAGLWRSKLIDGLAWQATGYAIGRTSDPPEYRSPSWSWASIDGPFGGWSFGIGTDAGEWEDVVEILDCQVRLESDDTFGEVTDAWIKMRAPLEALVPVEERKKQVWKMTGKNGSREGTFCIFDTLARAERAEKMDLYAIPLIKGGTCNGPSCNGKEQGYYHGIVVVLVPGREGTYERLGKVLLFDETLGECEWMKDTEKFVTITLV